MSRITVWNRRLLTASVFALLFAGLIGCGKQGAEVARQEAAKQEVTKQDHAARVEVARENPHVQPIGAYQVDLTGSLIPYDVIRCPEGEAMISPLLEKKDAKYDKEKVKEATEQLKAAAARGKEAAERLKAALARQPARQLSDVALDETGTPARAAGIDAKTLREFAETWSGRGPDLDRAKKIKEMMEALLPKHQALIKEYLDRLEKVQK